MTTTYDISEIYPNSPLVEVVCEIRFSGELAIECRRNEFFDRIRNKYPRILIPQPGNTKANPLAPYRFENEKQNAGIMLAINRFAFYEKDYSGHKKFIKEFKRLTKILLEVYSLKDLQRLGWRYINVIPYSREDGIVPLNRFVAAGVKVPKGISDQFENLGIVFVSRVAGGKITTKIESIIRQEDQQEALLLDFDFAMTEKLQFTRIAACIEKAHAQTRTLFESLITDEYRQYLREETI